jgi:hypothetical protein
MGLKSNIVGLLLLPFTLGFFISFLRQLFSIRTVGYGEFIFLAGVLIYLFIHYFIVKPKLLSTLAHEMTHAIWGIAFRAKVRDIRVKRESGFVDLSKTNFLIRLAPYFFPFFTMLAVLSTFIVKSEYIRTIYFFVGFTFTFHFISTLESLNVVQPDIYKTGKLFALVVIFLSNLMVIILVLEFVSPQNIQVMGFFIDGILESLHLFNRVA